MGKENLIRGLKKVKNSCPAFDQTTDKAGGLTVLPYVTRARQGAVQQVDIHPDW
jgi:hypothetical protein